ncbi:HrpJ domain-containing protein [Pantoea ananatis]|uniref:HrpJ domain-containing protein n=1 Tax=Pantoea ananas TaxID=553 RepID=UPI001B316CDA|nr:HrpJ domain-containing protein [Pantoea ananatis]
MSTLKVQSARFFHQNMHKAIIRSEKMAVKNNNAYLHNSASEAFGLEANEVDSKLKKISAHPSEQLTAESLADTFEKVANLHVIRGHRTIRRRVVRLTKNIYSENTSHLVESRMSISRIGNVMELYMLMEDYNQQRLEEMLTRLQRHLSTRERDVNLEEVISVTGGDPARAHVLLGIIQRNSDIAGNHATARHISEVMDHLENEKGIEVRFGHNSAKALADISTNANEKQRFRRVFYDILRSVSKSTDLETTQNILSKKLVKEILELFGRDRFVAGLRIGIRALGDDIAALSPSISLKSLHILHAALSQLSRLTSLQNDSESTLLAIQRKWKLKTNAIPDFSEKYTSPDFNLDGIDLMFTLVAMIDGGTYSRDVIKAVNDYSGNYPSFQLDFSNRLLSLIHNVPLVLWGDQKKRYDTFNLIREFIGQLSDIERKQNYSFSTPKGLVK